MSARTGHLQDPGNVRTDWANGRLITELQKRYNENLSIAMFSDPDIKGYDYEIACTKIYPLPYPFSYLGGLLNTIQLIRIFRQIEKEHDMLLVQLPIVGFVPLFFIRKPVIFHLCANVLAVAGNTLKYRGAQRVSARLVARLMHRGFKSLFGRPSNRLLVNGAELARLYPDFNPVTVVSSSIRLAEVIPNSQTTRRRAEESFRLVFVGRPDKVKGFPLLYESFKELRNRKANVVLSIIGTTSEEFASMMGSESLDEIAEFATFHGAFGWGSDFVRVISSSHCLILSSVSEGTPRVLIEARALGCPVVATRVGGVESSVTDHHDGILTLPGDRDDLVNGIMEMMEDEDLRQQLILNGLETARKFALENFAAVFVKEIDDYV